MPYYSELGLYTSPSTSSSVYSSGGYVPGPYANHSSIIAANFARPSPSLIKPVSRNFRVYKPHLATITESQSPLGRINSPKIILRSTPKVSVPRPIKINTADIDVSVNRYRKYERPNRPKDDSIAEIKQVERRKSPSSSETKVESPRSSLEQKEAKPNRTIRRDRPTVRIQTIHKDMLPSDILTTRRWRDNFEPDELRVEEERRPRKTPGELLVEKFLIPNTSGEKTLKTPKRGSSKKIHRRGSKKALYLPKTPSFHDICTAITTDKIDEELNPGQPIEVQRRQSRQLSTEDILRELRRNSTELVAKEIDEMLEFNKLKKSKDDNDNEPKEEYDSRNSVRKKKKLTKKKSNEKVTLSGSDSDGNKSGIHRRLTQKKIRRTNTDSSFTSDIVDEETEKAYQEAIRDISQVEIERIPVKLKPVITATVNIDEQVKPTLKAVIDDVEIEESPKPKKSNKFKFNVIVEEISEPTLRRRSTVKKAPKKTKAQEHQQQVEMHVPKSKEAVVTNILKRNDKAHVGHVLHNVEKTAKVENKVRPPSDALGEQEKLDILKNKTDIIVHSEANGSVEKTNSAIPLLTDNTDKEKTIADEKVDKPKLIITDKISQDGKVTKDDKTAVESKTVVSKIQQTDSVKKSDSAGKVETTKTSGGSKKSEETVKKSSSEGEVADSMNDKKMFQVKNIQKPELKTLTTVSNILPKTVDIKLGINKPVSAKLSDNASKILSDNDNKVEEAKMKISEKDQLKQSLAAPIPKAQKTLAQVDDSKNDTKFIDPKVQPVVGAKPVPKSAQQLDNRLTKTEASKNDSEDVSSKVQPKQVEKASPTTDESKKDTEDAGLKEEPVVKDKPAPKCTQLAKTEDGKNNSEGVSSKVQPKQVDKASPTTDESKKDTEDAGLKEEPVVKDKPAPKCTQLAKTEDGKNNSEGVSSKVQRPGEHEPKRVEKASAKTDETKKVTEPVVKDKPAPKCAQLAKTEHNENHSEDVSSKAQSLAQNQLKQVLPAAQHAQKLLPRSDDSKKSSEVLSSKVQSTVEDKPKQDTVQQQDKKLVNVQKDTSKPKVVGDKTMNKIVEETGDKLESNDSENFWAAIGTRSSVYEKPKKPVLPASSLKKQPVLPTISPKPKEDIVQEKPPDVEIQPSYMPTKRSLVNKANVEDPDLTVFEPPPEPEPEPDPEPQKDVFVPLQSNRISQFMHPFKKPEQFDVCPVEIFARPKTIRKRHYPRPRHPHLLAPQPPPQNEEESSEDDEDESSESEETSSGSSSDENEDEEYDVNVVYGGGSSNKVGASTSSNDSGFDSGVPGSRNKDCDVNCHKKCEKLIANLCGINQKLIVEAIESVRKDSMENRESPTSNPASNPAFALDADELYGEFAHSSTYVGFKKSGRITPPATTIPRFRKYNLEDFNFLKVLGKGSFGKVLLAELKNTDYYYAIKCLKKDVVLEDDDVECTLIERKVLALGTKHPYLCHLLCTFQTESHLFFVMEYLNGGDLMFHIQQSGRFPEYRAKFYGAEIVSGLKFLHQKGIVYRDLKLDNILLDFDGHVRIADFGMCKLQIFLDRMADTFCGTPDYMAPEIIKGQHYNQNVDWWSFGVLLYEMLIGQSPFSGCDEDELFWSICNEKPVIPRFLTTDAGAVLLLFLEKDATKRLGNRFCPAGDIMDQAFFKQIQWDKLEARQLEPPFKPDLLHPLDTQYFDKTFTAEKAKLTPIEQNILQSMDQHPFKGFSYTNPNATDK